jgi:hypothetical protein
MAALDGPDGWVSSMVLEMMGVLDSPLVSSIVPLEMMGVLDSHGCPRWLRLLDGCVLDGCVLDGLSMVSMVRYGCPRWLRLRWFRWFPGSCAVSTMACADKREGLLTDKRDAE